MGVREQYRHNVEERVRVKDTGRFPAEVKMLDVPHSLPPFFPPDPPCPVPFTWLPGGGLHHGGVLPVLAGGIGRLSCLQCTLC
jgi:hypothetical protein